MQRALIIAILARLAIGLPCSWLSKLPSKPRYRLRSLLGSQHGKGMMHIMIPFPQNKLLFVGAREDIREDA